MITACVLGGAVFVALGLSTARALSHPPKEIPPGVQQKFGKYAKKEAQQVFYIVIVPMLLLLKQVLSKSGVNCITNYNFAIIGTGGGGKSSLVNR
jgi:hypothetical protein